MKLVHRALHLPALRTSPSMCASRVNIFRKSSSFPGSQPKPFPAGPRTIAQENERGKSGLFHCLGKQVRRIPERFSGCIHFRWKKLKLGADRKSFMEQFIDKYVKVDGQGPVIPNPTNLRGTYLPKVTEDVVFTWSWSLYSFAWFWRCQKPSSHGCNGVIFLRFGSGWNRWSETTEDFIHDSASYTRPAAERMVGTFEYRTLIHSSSRLLAKYNDMLFAFFQISFCRPWLPRSRTSWGKPSRERLSKQSKQWSLSTNILSNHIRLNAANDPSDLQPPLADLFLEARILGD